MARRNISACGELLECIDDYNGLRLQLVVDHQHHVGSSWKKAVQQYRLRSAGPVLYEYFTSFCGKWIEGEGGKKINKDIVFVTLMLVPFLAILLFASLRCSRSSALRWRFMGLAMKTAFCGILITQLSLVLLILSKFEKFPDPILIEVCPRVFGPEAVHGGFNRPLWTQKHHAAGSLSEAYYALFSEFAYDPWEVPASSDVEEGLVAVTLQAYTAKGPLSEDITKTCTSFTAGELPLASPLPDLHSYLIRGGFGCKVARDPLKDSATLFISHPLLQVFRTRLLGLEQTARIIDLAEQSAKERGWTTDRHKKYATTDIPVNYSPHLDAYMRKHGLYLKLPQLVAETYADSRMSLWGLKYKEAFVVKYSMLGDKDRDKGQTKLDAHEDGDPYTTVSFNILLSKDETFRGGGTWLDAFGAAPDTKNGMAVTHSSKLKHGGQEITEGTRYILVGFMKPNSPFEFLSDMREVLFNPEPYTDILLSRLAWFVPFSREDFLMWIIKLLPYDPDLIVKGLDALVMQSDSPYMKGQIKAILNRYKTEMNLSTSSEATTFKEEHIKEEL